MIHTKSSYDYYMDDLRKYPVLDKQQNEVLVKNMLQGDQEARTKLINGNLKLVIFAAKKYQNEVVDYMDLIQQGNLGLIHAIDTYDPNRGALSTYIVAVVNQQIARYMQDQSRTIRKPVYQQELAYKIKSYVEYERQEYDHEPTIEEIAEALGLPEITVENIAKDYTSTISIHTPINSEGDLLADLIADDTVAVNHTGMKKAVEVALSYLTPEERDLMERYYGLNGKKPMTLRAIGETRDYSRQNVLLRKMDILNKLRYPDILAEIRRQL